MQLDDHQQLYHTYFGIYFYGGDILAKGIFRNNRVTYFLSLTAFRNKSYCRGISIDGFITYLLRLIVMRDKL